MIFIFTIDVKFIDEIVNGFTDVFSCWKEFVFLIVLIVVPFLGKIKLDNDCIHKYNILVPNSIADLLVHDETLRGQEEQ